MGTSKWLNALGGVVSLSVINAVAVPSASAADIGASTPTKLSAADSDWQSSETSDWREVTADHSRRGYRRGRYRGYRPRVDAGDIITGIVVLGTMAAIANSAKRARRAEQDSYRRDPENSGYQTRSGGGDTISAAMDSCMRAVERDVRVDNVEGVTRSGDGWIVRGALYNGQAFSCQVGGNGDVVSVNYQSAQTAQYPGENGPSDDSAYGTRYDAAYSPPQNNQYADAAYAEAWRRQAMAERAGSGNAYPVSATYSGPEYAEASMFQSAAN